LPAGSTSAAAPTAYNTVKHGRAEPLKDDVFFHLSMWLRSIPVSWLFMQRTHSSDIQLLGVLLFRRLGNDHFKTLQYHMIT
jgi:hypothetical protein